MSRFELIAEESGGRRGRLVTGHGGIETPAFMPVGTRSRRTRSSRSAQRCCSVTPIIWRFGPGPNGLLASEAYIASWDGAVPF